MKCVRIFGAAGTLLAALFVWVIQAQAQQEVDPTNYPLEPAVVHPSHQLPPHNVKQGAAAHTQHSIAKKTQKPAAGRAQYHAVKSTAKK